jgi:hypothetical protein
LFQEGNDSTDKGYWGWVQTMAKKYFHTPTNKGRWAKNLCTQLERLTDSCRVTCVWCKGFNLYSWQDKNICSMSTAGFWVIKQWAQFSSALRWKPAITHATQLGPTSGLVGPACTRFPPPPPIRTATDSIVLKLVVEVHASKNSVISWSVQKLYDHTTYVFRIVLGVMF